MPDADPRLIRKGQTKKSSRRPCWDLGPAPLPHSPGIPGGVPVTLFEKKNTPHGPRLEVTTFDCTCDPPLACMTLLRRSRGAKARRQRRRDLARGNAPPAAAHFGGGAGLPRPYPSNGRS